jgi:hypothetical protein
VVEVKVSVHPDDIDHAEHALGLDSDGRVEGEVYFFDDASLSAYSRGVLLRARSRHGDSDDSTVKLRPMVPKDVPGHYTKLDGFKCEGDRAGGKTVVSCSLTEDATTDEINEVAAGKRDIDKLFKQDQESLSEDAGKGKVAWQSLRVLGPIPSTAWKKQVLGIDVAAERWVLPDGERSLELSSRCDPKDAAAIEAKLAGMVKAAGARLAEDQESKTKRALTYFASH